MIQDIHPHSFNNHYHKDSNIEDDDYVFHYKANTILLKTIGDTLEIPRKKDFPEIDENTECTFLFTIDEVSCFLVWQELTDSQENLLFKEISFFRSTSQKEIAWACIAGNQLRNWYSEHKFCGKCGSATHHKDDERAMICPNCNTVEYPKISPAIIVAIISNDKILLARNANFPVVMHSLIAGYVDVGETLEETVKREVKEEVGLDVWNIRYYKSQPWPLSSSMMIGFIAEADENQPISLTDNEIAEAAWYTRGNLPNHALNISIAGEMIEKFEKGEFR